MNETHLDIGYGIGTQSDSFAAGEEAAVQAIAMIQLSPRIAVMVYASARFEFKRVLQGIRSVIPDVPLLGCTTAGEICNGALEESVVVTVIASPFMKVTCGLGRNVAKDWSLALDEAIGGAELRRYFDDAAYGQEMTLKGRSAFGLLLSPGNTRHSPSFSFEILEAIKVKSLGRLPVFGGSAADDWRMDTNHVFWGEEAFPDSLLLAVFETQLQFGLAMDHGFMPTGQKTTVTRAQGHEVLELDGGPAADQYARNVGASRETLEGKHLTLTTGHTMGTADAMGQSCINVASFFTPRGGIRFTQPVTVGTELTLMDPADLEVPIAGREALRKAILRGNITRPGLSMVAYCALRPRILGEKAQKEIRLMAESSPGVPLVGFKSFGEQGLADDGSSHHNNAVVSVLVLGKDLSPVARVADENEKLQARLRLQTRIQHAQMMESLGRMAGGVAHDMNNVLGAILSLASSHLSCLPREHPLHPSLETIRDAAVRGGDAVKRLLAFSRQTPGARQVLDGNALVLEEAKLLERTIPARIRLALDLAPDLHPMLGDGSALAQALRHIRVNAMEAMPDGGTLTFGTRNLGHDEVEVSVEDTGIGMPREVLDRAVDPFFTTKDVGDGTGLGLSLVFTTVTAHGGRLELQSEPGQGTRVTMTFPATDAQAPAPPLEVPLRPRVEGAVLQVLVVDDDELIQKSTRLLVEILGHAVTIAASGEAALMLLEQGLQPDAVLLDMNMPGLGGQGTLPRLRRLLPAVPVLLATGRSDQEALDLVRSEPFVTLLPKPYSIEDLRAHLQQVARAGSVVSAGALPPVPAEGSAPSPLPRPS